MTRANACGRTSVAPSQPGRVAPDRRSHTPALGFASSPVDDLAPIREARVTLTVPEAARMLGISRNEAYLAVQRGEIPARRIGRRIVIPRVAFERWLDDAPPCSPR